MAGFYGLIARYYDAEHSDKCDDLAFYEYLIDSGGHGPLLEIGCGSGRVLFHLAQQLETVHGIDSEAAMLGARAAASRRRRPHYKCAFVCCTAMCCSWSRRSAIVMSCFLTTV